MSGIQTRLDGSTLVGRFPIQFQICGRRKRVVVPDGSRTARTGPRRAVSAMEFETILQRMELQSDQFHRELERVEQG